MRYLIRTPVVGFTGEAAGVVFVKGEATVDDTVTEHVAALQFFRRRGYGIRALDPAPASEDSAEPVITDADFGGRAKEPALDGTDPAAAPEPDGQEAGGAEPPARPAKNASQDDWAAYASAVLLLPAEEANALTRTELVALVDAHDKETQQS